MHEDVLDKYREPFDASFLAYPSDRPAEAFSIGSGGSSEFSEIGIISIAVYRTHCIHRAVVLKRKCSDAWDAFDEDAYWDDLPTLYVSKKRLKTVDYALSDKDHIKLTKRDWRSLAVLYGMSKATSVDKYHSLHGLNSKHRKELGWRGNVNYSNLLDSNLVDDRSYGVTLSLFNLSHEVYYRRKKLRKLLKQKMTNKEWQKLVEQSKVWEREHRKRQKSLMREILRFQ